MSSILTAFGTVQLSVPANEAVAVYTQGGCAVSQLSNVANYPAIPAIIGRVSNGQTVFGPYAAGATLSLTNTTGLPVYYEVGTSPVVKQARLLAPVQVAPTALNVTGTLTPALALAGIVTSSTAAAVTATLDTAANWEVSSDWLANDTLEWSVINTGGANAFTLQQDGAATHTVLGSGTVAASTSAKFLTRRVSATSFVTYRVS